MLYKKSLQCEDLYLEFYTSTCEQWLSEPVSSKDVTLLFRISNALRKLVFSAFNSIICVYSLGHF